MDTFLHLTKVVATGKYLALAEQQIPRLNAKISNIWLEVTTDEIILLENRVFSPKNYNSLAKKLSDFYIFPELYWLSSKNLVQQISELETSGLTKLLQARLNEDKTFLTAFKLSVMDFKLRRKNRLAYEDSKLISQFNLQDKFLNSGLSAVKNNLSIKCLHAHYAHYLASNGNNIIGKILVEQYGLPKSIQIFSN